MILNEICKKTKINCEILTEYTNNRKKYLDTLCFYNNITKQRAKEIYITCMNGGEINKREIWMIPKHLIKFKNQMNKIAMKIIKKFPNINEEVNDKIKTKIKNNEYYTKNGMIISLVCNKVENYIINKAIKHIQNNKPWINNNIVPCFDGFMPLKSTFINKIEANNYVKKLTNYINKSMKIKIEFTIKDLKNKLRNEIIKYNPNKKKNDEKQSRKEGKNITKQNKINCKCNRNNCQHHKDKIALNIKNYKKNTNKKTKNNNNIKKINNHNKTKENTHKKQKKETIHQNKYINNKENSNKNNENNNKNSDNKINMEMTIALFNDNKTKIITKERIKKTIGKLMEKKGAPGLSAIPIQYYFWGGNPMIEMLYNYYSILDKIKIIPQILKLDIKAPIPKYDKNANNKIKQDPANYRPIALQNIMYKILDGNIKIELDQIDKNNNIIQINQGGFKQKEGAIEHLFVLKNIWHYNNKICCAFLDLKKAYDSVWREKLYKKLEVECKINKNTIDFIKAMYKNTWSTVRINNKLSPKIQTHKGLFQGALSSPILFNFFINSLIKELNKTKIGLKINNVNISSLMFADDIYLNANNPEKLQTLLKICANWANKHKLTFSKKKSETLSNYIDKLKPLNFQNGEIKNVKKGSYKYLGIPIFKKGFDKKNYLRKQRMSFFMKRNMMQHFCDKYKLNTKHRIIIYKSVIRSQFDYGTSIINYSNEEINKLDYYQCIVLKKLLNINKDINYHTLLYILDIPTMKERINTIKIKFCYKLRNNNSKRSMAKKIFDELFDNKNLEKTHKKQTAPIIEYKKILQNYNLSPIFSRNNDMNEKEIKEFMENKLKQNRLKETKKVIKHIQTKKVKKYNKIIIQKKPPLLKRINNEENCNFKYDKNYINENNMNISKTMIKILTEHDNNPLWQMEHKCKHCKMKNIKKPETHKMLRCKKYKNTRTNIFRSLKKEIENYRIYRNNICKNISKTNDIKKEEEIIIDSYLQNNHNNININETMNILLGNNIKNSNIHKKKWKTILNSHMKILMEMDKIEETDTENYIKIKGNNFNEEDIKKGMIIVRQKINNRIIQTNIRNLIDKMEISDLHKYNVGLGAASSRTDKQKILAQEYTNKIISNIKTDWITSDASINKKLKQGGIGILAINKNNQETFRMCESLETEDAQFGEIYGIKRILDMIIKNKIKSKNNIAIVCDCKNAIKIITNYMKCPSNYKHIIQNINENLFIINKKLNIKTKFLWIPGHTENKYNDIVDEMAKEAANKKLPTQTQQLSCPLRSLVLYQNTTNIS
ncbi:MAG: hypothetical protein GY755_13825 [Chloroflexi bacterium]|nr:hypothetical protein [Chloroflexota bacterium]